MSSRPTAAVERLITEGRALVGTGDLAGAEVRLRQALAAFPEHPEALHLMGIVAIQRNDPEQAVSLIERAIAHKRSEPRYLINLGIALSRLGRHEHAERAFRRALRLQPARGDIHSYLGVALADQGKLVEALKSHDRAVQLSPDSAPCHRNRGLVLKSLGRLEEAAAAYGQAIAHAPPGDPSNHYGLGVVLGLLGRYAEADASLRKALAAQPDRIDALLALGLVCDLAGRYDEALATYDRALSLAPSSDEIHMRKASTLLRQGALREGWREYEWRIAPHSDITFPGAPRPVPLVVQRPSSCHPLDLNGKRLLLVRDQGLGDELFFLGFAKLAKQQGAWIAYLASPQLRGVLAGAQELDAVVGPEALPVDIDLVVSVGDLPGLVGIERIADIPAPLALTPSAQHVAAVRTRLAQLPPGPLLGITWRGGVAGPRDNQLREVAPEALALALAGWPGPVLVLQRNPRPEELAAITRALGRPAHDFSDLNNDLDGMLALLSLLDEYVGIGNTNMHLRATMGRTSRVLVPHRAEWMWDRESSTSPWLPHLVLYRNRADQVWDAAVAALSSDVLERQAPRIP